jgi:hypothetical protein
MPVLSKLKTQSSPVIKKAVVNTANPGEALPVKLVKGNYAGDYVRVFLGSLSGIRREVILHHPIGITDLDGDEWVESEFSDLPLLLSRKDDPYKNKLAELRAGWLVSEAIASGYLKREPDGSVVYDVVSTTTTRKQFFDELKAEFIKNQRDTKQKFDINVALAGSIDVRSGKEALIRKLFAEKAEEADAKFASAYLTCGGSRADRPQVPVKWAKNLTPQIVCDMLIKHGLDGPQITTDVASVGVTASVAPPSTIAVSNTGKGTYQWCFLPKDLKPETKRDAKKAFKELKDIFGAETGKDYIFSVQPVKS